MAKKTNKTEHVLNLLMSQNEAEDDDIDQVTYGSGKEKAAKEAGSSPGTEADAEAPIHAGSAAPSHGRSAGSSYARSAGSSYARSAGSSYGRSADSSYDRSADSSHDRSAAPPHNVMFVDSLQIEDHPVSGAIKESLEREAIQMGLLPPKPSEKIMPAAYEDADSNTAASENTNNTAAASVDAGSNTAAASVDAGSNTAAASENTNNTALASENTSSTAAASENTSSTAAASEDAESASPKACSSTAQKGAPLPAYRYVNVMENGVSELLMEYMTKLGVCTCDRCQKDVTALAMSNLPPKYIVADTAAVSPLLNFYRTKYSSHIMTELTKACFAVMANPRH